MGQPCWSIIPNFNIEWNTSTDEAFEGQVNRSFADLVGYAKNYVVLKQSGQSLMLPAAWSSLIVKPTAGGN